MSEFIKKTTFGQRPVPGGLSDPECTHVVLTKEEYDELLREKAQAEQEARNTAYEAEKSVKRAQDNALSLIRKTEEEAWRSVDGMERELAAERTESAYQRSLNANLLRISKERANASRKLNPKKEHTGYVVVSSAEKEHRYKDSNRYWKSVTLWETALQSPYSVDFTEDQARKQMLDELFHDDENGHWPIQKIGITGSYNSGYAEMIKDPKWQEIYHQYNVMLDRHLRANFRSGYWEIVFLHTKALGVILKEMRVR